MGFNRENSQTTWGDNRLLFVIECRLVEVDRMVAGREGKKRAGGVYFRYWTGPTAVHLQNCSCPVGVLLSTGFQIMGGLGLWRTGSICRRRASERRFDHTPRSTQFTVGGQSLQVDAIDSGPERFLHERRGE